MKCEDIQFNLSIYLDDILTKAERETVDSHLAQCPLCRQKAEDYQMLRRDLQMLERAPLPAVLLAATRNRVGREIEQNESKTVFTESFRRWLLMSFMPYGVATVLSLTFGITLLWSLLSTANGSAQNAEIARLQPFNKPLILTPNADSIADFDGFELTQADYAAARLSVSGDSPSLNPKGALLALTKSLVRGNMKDDEVVVVADVFGNGLAQIAEVVEPSSDRSAVRQLEKALKNNNSDFAPFVPAVMDNRSDTVRVVLKIQRVDVQTNSNKVKK
jgi:hypothetical protein